MDGLVEQVLSLCPESDREEVERDLNITGDIELTINHALDGLLSPRRSALGLEHQTNKVTIIMDDDEDDIVVLPSSKYTNVKEKNTTEKELNTDTSNILSSNFKGNIETTNISKATNKNDPQISVDLSDSELKDVSDSCRKTLEKLKSSIVYLEASTSKPFGQTTSAQSVPSSPDSDSELLKPAFGYNKNNYSSVKTSQAVSTCNKIDLSVPKTSRPEDSSKNVIHSDISCPAMGARTNVEGLGKRSEVIDKNECLEEPVKKKKRTKEEIEERKREAMAKRAAKEKERQEKLEEKKRQKEARAAVMQEKKLQKEKDQLQRKADRLTKSTNKLDGCLKFITVYLDPALFPDETPDPNTSLILQKLISMEANYVITPQPYSGSISWTRTTVQHSVQTDDLKITTSDSCKEENEVLVVLPAEQFAEMVFSFKQGYVDGRDNLENYSETLANFTKYIKNIYRGKKVTFLISGLEKYMRNVKLKQQRAFRSAAVGEPAVEDGTRKRRKKKTQPVLDVTRTDIEEALVDLQIKTNVCVYQCETDEDIALKIAVFTKAVAEKPYKKSLTDEIGFCLDRLDKTSLKVSKDGQGMVNVWQQQIQQFRNVSREMAAAIVAEYPSPQLLKRTYEQCRSQQDAMLLLEDILVRRGGGSLATSRRIGPELSKRFYVLFHSNVKGDLVKG